MKAPNAIMILFFLCTVNSVYALPNQKTKQGESPNGNGRITVIKDLGVLPVDDSVVKTKFTWKNTFNRKLTIKKVGRSCSCLIVDPMEGIIEPDQTVTFSVEGDVSGWYGNSAIQIVVIFKEDMDIRLDYTATFFVESSLKPSPKEIDFGYFNDPMRAKASFNIIWVIPPDGKSIEFYPNIFSENGLASCHIDNYTKEKTRSPNIDSDEDRATKQKYMFEVFLRPDIPRGEFHDKILIPVKVGDKREYVFLPVKGYYHGEVFSNPKSLFWPIRKSDEKITITLYRQNWCEIAEDFRVSCDDSRLKIVTKKIEKPVHDQTSVSFAEIEISVNSLDSETKKFETDIQIEYETLGKKHTFNIPTKVISFIKAEEK